MKKIIALILVVSSCVFVSSRLEAVNADAGDRIFRADDSNTVIIGWYTGNTDGYAGLFGMGGPLFSQTSKKVYGVYGVVTSSNSDSAAVYGVSVGNGYGIYSKGKAKVEGNLNVTGAISSSSDTNLALTADLAIASSEYNASYAATKINDGIYGRWDEGEWASLGEKGNAWIQLNWVAAIDCNKVVMYPRVNKFDQIYNAYLQVRRQDGSVTDIKLGQFSNGGAPREIQLSAAEGTDVVAIKVLIVESSPETMNIGLAEIQVYRDLNIW